MKYLISFNESKISLYEQISGILYDNLKETRIDFNKSELSKISDFFKVYDRGSKISRNPDTYGKEIKMVEYNPRNLKDNNYSHIQYTPRIQINNIVKNIEIYKIPDDYYLVHVNTNGYNIQYNCDELEGLFSVLSVIMSGYKKVNTQAEQLKKEIISKVRNMGIDDLQKIKNLFIINESKRDTADYTTINIDDPDWEKKHLEFTESELRIFNDYFRPYSKDGDDLCYYNNITKMMVIPFDRKLINIIKIEDEWFLVSYGLNCSGLQNRYLYRCDQMHGLIGLLDSIMIRYKRIDKNKVEVDGLKYQVTKLLKTATKEELEKIKDILKK